MKTDWCCLCESHYTIGAGGPCGPCQQAMSLPTQYMAVDFAMAFLSALQTAYQWNHGDRTYRKESDFLGELRESLDGSIYVYRALGAWELPDDVVVTSGTGRRW